MQGNPPSLPLHVVSADLAEATRWRLDLANQLGVPPH